MALASIVLQGAPAHKAVRYATTVPGIYGDRVAFIAELAISFILMSAILFASDHAVIAPYTHYVAAVLIAVYIAFESPLSGMSTNPARTFGPAVYSCCWLALWIYFSAPPLGMIAAAELFLLAREGKDPYCAKLNHQNDKRCIFRHSGPSPGSSLRSVVPTPEQRFASRKDNRGHGHAMKRALRTREAERDMPGMMGGLADLQS